MREEKTIEQYSKNLWIFITTSYSEKHVKEALSYGHHLEAIGSVHIQISELLRFLLTKKIKEHENIPLDLLNPRFRSVIDKIKNLTDSKLYDDAFIYGRINEEELRKLKELNKLRNAFAHSYSKRENYTEDQVKNIIEECQEIERKLHQESTKYS